MPKSVASYRSFVNDTPEEDDEDQGLNTPITPLTLSSPTVVRRMTSSRTSDVDLRSRMPSRLLVDETTSLLSAAAETGHYDRGSRRDAGPPTPRPRLPRSRSSRGIALNHSRANSVGGRVARAWGLSDQDRLHSRNGSGFGGLGSSKVQVDDRVWYDQFTSTDWVHDSIADAFRMKELRSQKGFRGRAKALFDATQGWILVAVIGCLTALMAYIIDITETSVYDIKTGYCSTKWYYSKQTCCSGATICDDWRRWSVALTSTHYRSDLIDFAVFNFWVIILAVSACFITLRTKTTISSAISLSTLDENLGADRHHHHQTDGDDKARPDSSSPERRFFEAAHRPPVVYYPAAGSGVAEVKVILSGFVLHGYLGLKTLVAKSIALILSVGSGMSIGKEGPYVHIATCIGNIACRLFSKYNHNDGKRREILSAAAASGVAVAFGAPISGVLFSLEEVSYYFPPKTLFRTFFCCIAAALSLKFFDPYGTKKIVLFEVRYLTDWRFFEMAVFAFLGISGGILGALFIKVSRMWAQTFRRLPAIKQHPMLEVFIVALITGLISFWNQYDKLPVAELLYELAAPCDSFSDGGHGLCPTKERIPEVVLHLCAAFMVKAFLTVITFGIKVPAGIYVPSMVVGGLFGRIIGHLVQLLPLTFPHSPIWGIVANSSNPESIVVPGVYALTAAGATMCGVTRLSVTLSVILFELTGSLEHVLPFSIGVLFSKWTADALEPHSIYDLLTDMNAYPYLDSKARPIFTNDLGDITPLPRRSRLIDISASPLIPASELRKKLDIMHMSGELDGGLPILRDNILIGLIPGPDLEFALDNLDDEDGEALCLMDPQRRWQSHPKRAATTHLQPDDHEGEDSDITPSATSFLCPRASSDSHVGDLDTSTASLESGPEIPDQLIRASAPQRFRPKSDPTDFTPYIDPAPVTLDICSPMDLVFECFVKLGLRYICVLKEGRFAGLVHKKGFVRYVKTVEGEQRMGRH